MRRLLAAATAAIALTIGLTVALLGSPAGAASSAPGSFTSVAPLRILDTRYGIGAPKAPVAPNATVVLQVGGQGGLPASGLSAVVLNLTVTQPTSFGSITVWGDGDRPWASNLNFVPRQTVPNLVVAPVGAGGKVRLYNASSGTVQLLADVSGYYLAGGAQRPGMFTSVTPSRVLDTRYGVGTSKGAVAAGGTVVLPVAGRVGLPAAGVSAVVLNVTVTAPTAVGSITVWGDGSRPWASNLNFVRGQTVPNLVVAPVDSDGNVRLYNASSGTVQLLADVAGYYLAGGPLLDGGLGAVPPVRVLDTRYGVGTSKGAVPAGGTITLIVGGRGWLPPSGVSAVVLNVTVTAPTAVGSITVWGDGSRPWASNLNFVRGQTVPNLVMAPVSPNGTVSFYNASSGTVQVLADVAGYVLGADRTPAPAASTSRYVRNISDGGATDVTTMHAEGCADAQNATGAGPYVTLLHIGAQSQHDPLSKQHPGVALSGFADPNKTPRLTYSELVTALDGYLDGYTGCRSGSAPVTIAIGTNNDGDWQQYTAAEKGTDWATQVIEPLRTHVAGALDVVGAIDIEAGFSSSETDAESWERAYLTGTSAKLIYDGSLDACPTAFGTTGQSCGAVIDDNKIAKTWTQAQYLNMAHGLSPGRIVALPQIYVPAQAWQWANLARQSQGQLAFAGSLTEHAAVPGEFDAEQGWGALADALAGQGTTPPAPASAADLRSDDPPNGSEARNSRATLPTG